MLKNVNQTTHGKLADVFVMMKCKGGQTEGGGMSSSTKLLEPLSLREGLCARCREKVELEAGLESLTWSEPEDEVIGLPDCK